MKSAYLGIGVLILLVVGIALFNMQPKAAIAPEGDTSKSQPVVEEQKTTNENPVVNGDGMSAEEHAKMMGESTQGSDAGMEMPVMDTDPGMDMDAAPGARMIMVSGKNFEFDKKEIRVKKGEKITIHFESADGFHDLVIDELNVRTEKLKTGGMQMVTFVADKVGTFEYYCSVGSHRANGMVGKLIVE